MMMFFLFFLLGVSIVLSVLAITVAGAVGNRQHALDRLMREMLIQARSPAAASYLKAQADKQPEAGGQVPDVSTH